MLHTVALGKQKLRLENVLLIESMKFNIISLQKLRADDFHCIFKELPRKVVLRKELPNGDTEQMLPFTETRAGRSLVSCHPVDKLNSSRISSIIKFSLVLLRVSRSMPPPKSMQEKSLQIQPQLKFQALK